MYAFEMSSEIERLTKSNDALNLKVQSLLMDLNNTILELQAEVQKSQGMEREKHFWMEQTEYWTNSSKYWQVACLKAEARVDDLNKLLKALNK